MFIFLSLESKYKQLYGIDARNLHTITVDQ